MILFYTGAVQANFPQNISVKSLGGYVSSTVVPNNLVSNIFSPLSTSDIKSQKKQLRCIVLKNTFQTEVTNVQIFTEIEEDSKSNINLGFQVEMFVDKCGEVYTESIQQSDQLPYYITFNNYTELEPFTIPSILPGNSVAIWLSREPILESQVIIPNPLGKTDCELEFETLQEIEENTLTVDGFKLIIAW